MAFKPCLLSCLRSGHLLHFSEPAEEQGGVWIGWTSDSLFHLLFLGKGLGTSPGNAPGCHSSRPFHLP